MRGGENEQVAVTAELGTVGRVTGWERAARSMTGEIAGVMPLHETRFSVIVSGGVRHLNASCARLYGGHPRSGGGRVLGVSEIADLGAVLDSGCGECARWGVETGWLGAMVQAAIGVARAQRSGHGWGEAVRACVWRPQGCITRTGIAGLLATAGAASGESGREGAVWAVERPGVSALESGVLARGVWHDVEGWSLVREGCSGARLIADHASAEEVRGFVALWECFTRSGERRGVHETWELARAVGAR